MSSKNAPLVCFVTDQSVYESTRWESRNILARDASVRTMSVVINKFPDGASKPVIKGQITRKDRVILVFAGMIDVSVIRSVITYVVQKAECVAGLHLYMRELRADKIDKKFRLLKYHNSMTDHSASSEDEPENARRTPSSKIEEVHEQEILMAPHVVSEVTEKITGHFLVSHSDVVLTPSSADLNMMMYFVRLVVEDLTKAYTDCSEYAFVIVFPDFGAKHRFAEQIEVLFDTLKLAVHLIACDKERDGQVTTTSLKLSDRQKAQLQQQMSFVIVIDDIVRSGKTSIDALNLVREKGHADNKYVIACFHLPIVNEDGFTINNDIENTLVQHINDGTLSKLYTTDSIPIVTCNLHLPPVINVMPVTARAVKDVLEAEHMW